MKAFLLYTLTEENRKAILQSSSSGAFNFFYVAGCIAAIISGCVTPFNVQ